MRFEKWSVLAGLRFLLACIVAMNHMPKPGFLVHLGAFEAVLGFLVISGYSIGSSYQREPDGFLLRRVKRIYPIYIASMVLTCFVYGIPGLWELLANLLFLNQIVTRDSFIGPAWSLALEFWLYCLTPVLVRLKLGPIVWISFAAFVIHTVGRTAFHWDYYAGLGFGLNLLLLSWAWIGGLRISRGGSVKPVAFMFAAHMVLDGGIQAAYCIKHGLPLMPLASEYGLRAITLALVVAAIASTTSQGARSKAMRLAGDVSFPLFLVHVPVYTIIGWWGWSGQTAQFLSALAVAAVMFLVLDRYSQKREKPRAIADAADALKEARQSGLAPL